MPKSKKRRALDELEAIKSGNQLAVSHLQCLLEVKARDAAADGLRGHRVGKLGSDELISALAIEGYRGLLDLRGAQDQF